MACFLVAATVGVFTTAFRNRIPEKYHIGWLNIMIWASVLALLVEHIWQGEIVPWFPFLTAMSDPADTAEMLTEMAQIGFPACPQLPIRADPIRLSRPSEGGSACKPQSPSTGCLRSSV